LNETNTTPVCQGQRNCDPYSLIMGSRLQAARILSSIVTLSFLVALTMRLNCVIFHVILIAFATTLITVNLLNNV